MIGLNSFNNRKSGKGRKDILVMVLGFSQQVGALGDFSCPAVKSRWPNFLHIWLADKGLFVNHNLDVYAIFG